MNVIVGGRDGRPKNVLCGLCRDLRLKDGSTPRLAVLGSQSGCDASGGWKPRVDDAKTFVFPPLSSKSLSPRKVTLK